MSLSLVGILPVSALNIGITAALPGIQSAIAKLTKLQVSLQAQAEIAVNLPNLPLLAAAISVQLTGLPTTFDPLSMFTASFDAKADIGLKLGLIEAELALVGELAASLNAGLNTGGLTLWTYAGKAASFGELLAGHTATGFDAVGPNDQIFGLIIATESFSSWGSFSASFNTGSTSTKELETTDSAELTYVGTLTGGQLDTGVLEAVLPINLYLLDLEALKLNLEASLQVCLGLNLPPLPMLTAGLNVDLQLLLDNLINVNVDLAAEISGLQLQIELLLELVVKLTASLSAGGLALWVYSGPARGLGSEFRTAIVNGIPGGSGPDVPAYGIVVSTKLPAAWAAFGAIFATS
jgi:hypothetical protein